MRRIPFITVTARSNYELGHAIGASLREHIVRRVALNRVLYRRLRLPQYEVLVEKARRFLPALEGHVPHLLEELRGMAAGADIPFDDLLVSMCEEELTDMGIPRCTSIALKRGDEVLVGHNEDWLTGYRMNGLYVLRATFRGNSSLSLGYVGSLPGTSSGMNDHGLCFTANSLNVRRFRYGVPIKFQFRAMLDATSLERAFAADLDRSSISGSTLYGWRNTRIVDIEDYVGHHVAFTDPAVLVHTNHPLQAGEQQPYNTAPESLRRYERAVALVRAHAAMTHGADLLRKVLTDHEVGICSHAQPHVLWGTTIASVIMHPGEQWMRVCWSNPCKHRFTHYAVHEA